MADDPDRTASLMTPSKLAQFKPKAAASPAAWLDQMAADAGHLHLRRLAELRSKLEAQAGERDYGPLNAQLQQLGAALPRLDFGLLQPRGWLARATGKSKSAGAEFSAQFEAIDEAAMAVAAQTLALQNRQQVDAAATERTLVEFEVEFRAIEKIIDQGARWLQDMRTQLKERMAAAAGDAQAQQQVRDDAARCEILVARLKLLRAAVTAAQQAHQHAQGAAARRAALLQLLQQALASDVKAWKVRISALANLASDGNGPALSLEGPSETHEELQARVKQVVADCGLLQSQEQTLAASLAALAPQLEAAA